MLISRTPRKSADRKKKIFKRSIYLSTYNYECTISSLNLDTLINQKTIADKAIQKKEN